MSLSQGYQTSLSNRIWAQRCTTHMVRVLFVGICRLLQIRYVFALVEISNCFLKLVQLAITQNSNHVTFAALGTLWYRQLAHVSLHVIG